MKKFLITAVTVLSLVSLSACLGGKATESKNDAPSSNGKGDGSPAAVYWMPDGFSNWSEKCDGHGFRVFVLFHNNAAYGGITAIADPACG